MVRAAGTTNRSWVRNWATDSAVLLSSQVLTVIATTAAAIVVARSLSPEQWGIFSGLLGLSLALSLIAGFGSAMWLMRDLSPLLANDDAATETEAARRHEAARLLAAGMALTLSLGLVLVVAGAAGGVLAGLGSREVATLAALLTYGALTMTAGTLEAHLRARRRVHLVAVGTALEKLFLVVLLLVGALADMGLAAIGVAYLAAGVFHVVFNGAAVYGRSDTPLLLPSPGTVVSAGRASFPFALVSSSVSVVPRLDTFLVATVSTLSAAWFAIGERVLGPAYLAGATLGWALFPFVAGPAAQVRSPWRVSAGSGVVGTALALLGVALAPFLVPFVFGNDYGDAVPVVQVMLLVLPSYFATEPLLVFAYAHGKERSVVIATLSVSVLGTALTFTGQILGGAMFAAAGYVTRSVLLCAAAVLVCSSLRRRQTEAPEGEISAMSPLSPQQS